MLEIFKVFRKRSKWFFVLLAFLGLINSVWNMNLLLLINDSISGKHAFADYSALLFILLLVASVITARVFNGYMVKLTKNIIYEQGISIIDKVRFASYDNYRILGTEKVYTARMDIEAISGLPQTLITSFNSAVVVLCCLGYLFYLSGTATLILIGFMGAIAAFYLFQNAKLEKKLNKVRDLENNYFTFLKDLLYGFKEIKMSTTRNDNLFFKFLKANRNEEKKLGIEVSIAYLNNSFVGIYGWYVIIGIIIFLIPKIGAFTDSIAAAYTVAILYLMGHVNSLMELIPVFTRVKIAMERLSDFDKELNAIYTSEIQHGKSGVFGDDFKSLEFKNITYTYFDKKRKSSFSLGPVDLSIKAGELIFVTGGNGSGKSTFAGILTGLSKPNSGEIYLNGIPVEDMTYPEYRNQISAVFTNNYIFAKNYENFDLTGSEMFEKNIKMMGLDAIIPKGTYDNIVPETLSKGQHKRLSVVNAIMEERRIMMLDECAAELDPHFKHYFYTELLDTLKGMGKTVIVITHDDKYFGKADRFIKFEDGRIVIDKKEEAYAN
ncbi:MAG: hypothetical protein K0S32_2572 [Bacteroidetes bacterium]|jgi:cyclic peptide transporter|nr:hypothetical protein [Bacteroidota bacterium]